jgi:hypothetical protein
VADRMPISQIKIDSQIQSRENINQETVAEYAQQLKEGIDFPPVTVFFDGEIYWLADGFHRIAAAILADLQEFPAEIKHGSKRDAILFSVGSNASHGLRRTNADKRKAVLKLLMDEEWGKWSNREIARQCGVSLDLVNRLRDELSERIGQIDGQRKVQRNGKTYTINTGNIGKSKPNEIIDVTPVNGGEDENNDEDPGAAEEEKIIIPEVVITDIYTKDDVIKYDVTYSSVIPLTNKLSQMFNEEFIRQWKTEDILRLKPELEKLKNKIEQILGFINK